MADTDTGPSGSHPRAQFPRGLSQPSASPLNPLERGYRFGVDSLLLACFAARRSIRRVVDLGAGCGVVGLGWLLHEARLDAAQAASVTSGPAHDLPAVVAVEVQPELAACARSNAQRLELANVCKVIETDIRHLEVDVRLQPASFDLALANPPYRSKSGGRQPKGHGRRLGRFHDDTDAQCFVAAAARLLRPKGRFGMVFLPERLAELLDMLTRTDLAPKRLRLVHGRDDRPACMALVEAVKGGRPGLSVEPPLVLHGPAGNGATVLPHTPQALAFCPFLRCNPDHE